MDILEKVGLKYDDLNPTEKETYFRMLDSLKQGIITPDSLLDEIQVMKYSVEDELVNEPERLWFFIPNRKHLYLKARLKNYMLIEAFLLTPQKARKQVEDALGRVKNADT